MDLNQIALGQMTPATQMVYGVGTARASTRKRSKGSKSKTKKKAAAPRAKKRVKAAGKKRGKMVAGSAAAKAWGAKMRKMRKK